MQTFALLQDPGHNRVYYQQSTKLSMAELAIVSKKMATSCNNIRSEQFAGINYILFDTESAFTDKEFELLSKLSFVFGIFEVVEMDNNKFLKPIEKLPSDGLDPKISTILKYSGKTNEIFTKMMINVGLLSSDFDYTENIRLLDPVAGKGTTLLEAAIQGFDVFGIEIDKKSVHELGVFFKKYLEREKYKHSAQQRKYYGIDESGNSYIHEFEFAKNKDIFKDETQRKKLAIILGNTVNTSKYFGKNSMHLIIGDLPYGIGHGNSAARRQSNITRNPKELLAESLPEWHNVLKPGGTLVLAWNTFVLHKKSMIKLMEENGFKVLTDEAYNNFEHKVDASIKRDIVVAKK